MSARRSVRYTSPIMLARALSHASVNGPTSNGAVNGPAHRYEVSPYVLPMNSSNGPSHLICSAVPPRLVTDTSSKDVLAAKRTDNQALAAQSLSRPLPHAPPIELAQSVDGSPSIQFEAGNVLHGSELSMAPRRVAGTRRLIGGSGGGMTGGSGEGCGEGRAEG